MTQNPDMTLVSAKGRKYLTEPERKGFLRELSKHPKPTVQTLGSVLAHTGCRVSEALAIRACDVDLDSREIRFQTLKRRKTHWRAVPVPGTLVQALDLVHRVRASQTSARARERPLWKVTRQSANRQVRVIMHKAGITGPQACPRGLRHAFGVAAVEVGVPLPLIAALLGHANLASTAVYTTVIGAEARELVARMWV